MAFQESLQFFSQSPISMNIIRPVLTVAFSRELKQARKTVSLDTRALTSNTPFRSVVLKTVGNQNCR